VITNNLYFYDIKIVHMNRFILVIASLTISLSAFSQVDGNYNYSIGIRGYSLMQMPKILQQTNTDDYTNAWLNGGIIKFNDNQIAFRVSGHYLFKRDLTFANKCDECETAKGNMTDYAVKLGFEKNFNYSVIQPYFAADFGFRSNSFKGNVTPDHATSATAQYAAITSKAGGVFSPTLGIKANVLSRFSFFVESSMDFYYAYERQETVFNDAANTRTFAKSNKLEMLLNPVSVGIQIHLVRRN